VYLHEAYQRLQLEGPVPARSVLVSEYETLLLKNPRDPLFLYLAARAEAGVKTKEAIAKLRQSLEIEPSFALSHLMLAEIYSSTAYAVTGEATEHLDAFGDACPGSVRAFDSLRWSKDLELVARVAARLRRNVSTRTDTEVVEAYRVLWSLEQATERSDRQQENRARIQKDIERLFSPAFARNTAWLDTLAEVAFIDETLDQSERGRKEIAAKYPYSRQAITEKLAEARGTIGPGASGQETEAYFRRQWKAAVELLRVFPESQSLASTAVRSVLADGTASAVELAEVLNPYVALLERQPDESRSSPPLPSEAATRLVARGGAYQQAVALALTGLQAADTATADEHLNDLRGLTSEELKDRRGAWYLYTYYPLGEAYARLGRVADAKAVLLKYEELLEPRRPPLTAASVDKLRFGEDEARFWQLRGIVAEAEHRRVDALIAYRNAIASYPPRRPRGDRRDEALAAAEKLWKELGGTTQGWSDWAKTSPLTNFSAGAGAAGSTWGRLATSSPGLVLTDTLGQEWRPQDLARKTVFITIWASWCGPCRAELPYVEKLYQRFRGRDDVVILALNVDDDPKQMDVAIGELGVKIPSIAARNFAYSLVPSMALPNSWILTPSKTEMVSGVVPTLEAWLEKVTKAIEEAAK